MNRRRRLLRVALPPLVALVFLWRLDPVSFTVWLAMLGYWAYLFFVWAPKGPAN